MKRILVIVAAAGATAALGAATVAAGMLPAQAAAPSGHRARTVPGARRAAGVRQEARPVTVTDPIASQFGGEYVTTVRCTGAGAPPPIRLRLPGTPLTLRGTGPAAGVYQMLSRPNAYTTVYTCTIVVQKRVPARPAKPRCELPAPGGTNAPCTRVVTLNTGFGGAARAIAGHHPAG